MYTFEQKNLYGEAIVSYFGIPCFSTWDKIVMEFDLDANKIAPMRHVALCTILELDIF